MRRSILLSTAVVLSACGTLPQGPSYATHRDGCSAPPTLLFSLSGGSGELGATSVPYSATIAPPLRANGSSVFHLTSTIPLKIRVDDCEGRGVNSLAPTFALELLDQSGAVAEAVEVVRSSSQADAGNTLRSAGLGQYLFNFSTSLSGFVAEGDLVPGRYRLTISGPGDFEEFFVEFTLR
ncbi:MAG TPA: hypothetical protein VJK71_09540 [Gemmatimonadales bacterium]|nr:hypothetical protein [Gemmatimonadales bacterium]